MYIMAMASPTLLVKVTGLQMLGAFCLVIVGIIDRVQAVDRVTAFPVPFIFMPLWTGILILITAVLGLNMGIMRTQLTNSALVITFKTLNIFCSILCGFILFWYGTDLSTYAQLAQNGVVKDSGSFAVVAIIFALALIEILLLIMGVFASNKRNPTYIQRAGPPIENSNDQAGMVVPLLQVP
ncbi:uncharacterized protein [Montipora capricornis]|uniref:uncharacterized protein n=1 Tax=Montipora capricornis TaxID=246305 RepID=UPI0035F111CA